MKFSVYAGCRQFYLLDPEQSGATDDAEFWSGAALQARLAVGPGVIGVATDTYGDVPVTLEALESAPDLCLDSWDHVVEASIVDCSGQLTVLGCPDMPTGAVVAVPAGPLRVRVSSAGLKSSIDNSEYAGDSYLVQVWPAAVGDRSVLKHFG